ncbi:MAG TPA: ATP-binding cassette domain-containing protein [Bryobacteraceae bacterium]|nr:ATP-binding cassette domain-containing protein [Bryobacteraceae bacterium]
MPDATDDSVVRFENVTVVFDDLKALDGISFEIRRGQTRIIFGAAASGKSVMLKTALGLVRPASGRVFLFGQDITGMSEEQMFTLRGRVGVLFQEGGLFDSLTIEENVAYPVVNRATAPEERNGDVTNRVREALRFVELEHTLEKVPSELSGGMRRRVGIARAMVTEPALMLYDSPSAGLDPITANTIMALIVKARDTRNTTIAIVTHRYQDGHIMADFRYNPESGELEPAPRESGIQERTVFMVLRDGCLVFEGTRDELNRQHDPYVARFRITRQ